jgi:putative transposase
MHHHKNQYHPLFIILYVLDLLPYQAAQQIPRTTRNDWKQKKFEHSFGFTHCALYLKHFNDVAYAHKYSFTRYTLSIAIQIQKTFLAITQQSSQYKKLLRTQAHNIVEHITTLALKGFSVAQACKLFGLKTSWYHYHKRKINCPLNALKTCFKQKTNQLTYAEQQNIKQWIKNDENKNKNLTQLFYEALNNAIVFCCRQTFNFYAKLSGYKKPFVKPKAKQKKGYRATAIFECLHVDTTYISTIAQGVLKLTLVKDNFSKAPLHYTITTLNVTSEIIKNTLAQTFDKFKLFNRTHDVTIVSDGGSENKGAVLNWIGTIKAPPCVHKVIAHTDVFPFSNNMIESSFHLFKNDFLKRETITNEKNLIKKMDEFINHCHNRYFGEHYGITPQQILNGQQPDKNKFKTAIQQAAIQRRETNKNFKGCTMPAC